MQPHEIASTHRQKTGINGSFLQKFSDSVDKGNIPTPTPIPQSHSIGISTAFRRWSVCVSARPYTVICVTTIFALIWGTAFVLQFEQELDNDDLFTPTNAESKHAKAYVENLYGSYTSRVIHRRPIFLLESWA